MKLKTYIALLILAFAACWSLGAYADSRAHHKELAYHFLADKTITPSQIPGSDGLVGLAVHDNGNGTYSLSTYAAGGSSSVSSNITQWNGNTVDTNSGVKSAGTLRMVIATDQPPLTNPLLVDNSANTQPANVTKVNGTTIDTNSGNKSAGTQRTVQATDQPTLTNFLTPSWSVSSQTALTTTATVSGSSGRFGGYMFINLNSAPAYIQVFDTTGAVTLGSTTPTFVIPIPANSTAANGVGANVEFTNGITISNGIKIAATTTATGASTVGTGLTGFVLYK